MPRPTLSGKGFEIVRAVQPLNDALGRTPEKAFIGNLDTGESVPLIVNPAELREPYRANYNRIESPGLSHQRLQFANCPNVTLSLRAFFDQIIIEQVKNADPVQQVSSIQSGFGRPDEVEQARRFLISLVTPRRGTRLRSIAPSPVMFVWPGMIEMRMRLVGVEFDHLMFRVGQPRARAYIANIELEEAVPPGRRIFAEDVRRLGTQRQWAGERF